MRTTNKKTWALLFLGAGALVAGPSGASEAALDEAANPPAVEDTEVSEDVGSDSAAIIAGRGVGYGGAYRAGGAAVSTGFAGGYSTGYGYSHVGGGYLW